MDTTETVHILLRLYYGIGVIHCTPYRHRDVCIAFYSLICMSELNENMLIKIDIELYQLFHTYYLERN